MTDAATLAADPMRDEIPLAHHFDDPEQQHESALLGMWAFLATEVMFFGGVLAAYAVYRSILPEEFAAASRRLDLWLGAFNTVVLLGSSLAIALAVRASQLRDRKETVRYLAATCILGTAFLGIKGYEWYTEFQHHLVPGANFRFEHEGGDHSPAAADPAAKSGEPAEPAVHEVAPPAAKPHTLNTQHVQMFFVFYFILTGLHAIHMIIGLGILLALIYLIHFGKLPATGERPVEITGLYWHFVDIVWVFLYPLLYLIEVRP